MIQLCLLFLLIIFSILIKLQTFLTVFQRKRNGDQRAQDTNINLGSQPQTFSGARQVTCTHTLQCAQQKQDKLENPCLFTVFQGNEDHKGQGLCHVLKKSPDFSVSSYFSGSTVCGLWAAFNPQIIVCKPICCCLIAKSCPTLCDSLGFPVLHYLPELLKLMSIESVMPSNHLILCHPLLLLPSIFPNIRVFSNESALRIRWPNYWSFSFSISPSNEYSGPISFRMDWLIFLAVQGTLKSLLQHHSSKASIPQYSAFFRVQLSQPYMTTGKTIAWTIQTFLGKVASLLFNTPSRFLTAFLPRSKRLLTAQKNFTLGANRLNHNNLA